MNFEPYSEKKNLINYTMTSACRLNVNLQKGWERQMAQTMKEFWGKQLSSENRKTGKLYYIQC